MTDFITLVADMRANQKEYFATRKKGALIASKDLEKQVDERLDAIKEINGAGYICHFDVKKRQSL